MHAKQLLSFSFILLFAHGCISIAPSSHNRNDNIATGTLSADKLKSLKEALIKLKPGEIKDTIIIKYDYNYESCWNNLDRADDAYIMGFVHRYNENVKNLLASRPQLSIYSIREPGVGINKIKYWNDSIVIDKNRSIKKLLFKKKSICGNSIMIMPDGKYIFINSDSHNNIFYVTAYKISTLFK